MPVIQTGILLILLLVMPVVTGAGVVSFIKREKKNIVLMWIAGILVEWGLFQFVAVPAIVKGVTFTGLAVLFLILTVIMALAGGFLWLFRARKSSDLRLAGEKPDRGYQILWGIAILGILVQMVLNFIIAFEDGDDAFYVTTSNLAVQWDSMYKLLPYTFGTTSLDFRHCLAPFPIWIAFLAKFSGMHPTILSHTVMPLFMIPLSYAVYGMIGSRMLGAKKKMLPVFMIFVELLVLWGNYSVYTAETFLISRSRQGKAMLCATVIPMMFLIMHMIGERVSANKKVEKSLWLLLFAAVLSAALGSTMGTFLAALLIGVYGICMMFTYRKWKLLVPLMLCLMPALIYMGAYAILR